MTSEPHRSGAYIKEPSGYRAFHPAPLPPNPAINMDQDLWSLLSQADTALGRLDGVTATLPNPDLFVFMYVRKEAVLSSQIEGTQASLLDVLEFETDLQRSEQVHDVREVMNYVDAIDYGLERLRTFPLSLRLIKEIHEVLLAGVRGGELNPGEFRTSQNWVGPSGSTLLTATYVPPPPHYMRQALANLELFMHDDTMLPNLIKVGLIHSQFESIHPFLDGNGRMGRLLITFLLCQMGVLKLPLLYLSYYFKLHRAEYYDRLQAVRDKGDWEGWLRFFLRGVATVAKEASSIARYIVKMRERHRSEVNDRFGRGSHKALLLLEHLYEKPVISVQTAREVTGLSFPNANSLVQTLCEMGLLAETTGQKRNRKFSYHPYLRLFHDQEAGLPDLEVS